MSRASGLQSMAPNVHSAPWPASRSTAVRRALPRGRFAGRTPAGLPSCGNRLEIRRCQRGSSARNQCLRERRESGAVALVKEHHSDIISTSDRNSKTVAGGSPPSSPGATSPPRFSSRRCSGGWVTGRRSGPCSCSWGVGVPAAAAAARSAGRLASRPTPASPHGGRPRGAWSGDGVPNRLAPAPPCPGRPAATGRLVQRRRRASRGAVLPSVLDGWQAQLVAFQECGDELAAAARLVQGWHVHVGRDCAS